MGCNKVALELNDRLSRLATNGQVSRFKSYRQALKSVWNKETIDTLFKRLERFRGEINTYLLSAIQYACLLLYANVLGLSGLTQTLEMT
jgi:hypothetical protein